MRNYIIQTRCTWVYYIFQVCKYVCSKIYNKVCSSVLYDKRDKSCVLSPYTGDDDIAGKSCFDKNMEFYRRRRCLGKLLELMLSLIWYWDKSVSIINIILSIESSSIRCDFEDQCEVLVSIQDEIYTDYWKLVKAENNIVSFN